MGEKQHAEGKCLFCGKTYAKAGINRHLKTHLQEKAFTNAKGNSYLVKVEQGSHYGSGLPYFLSLWVDGNATMKDIDNFLRDIWLECCGHMSAFRDPAVRGNGGMWSFFEAEELLEAGKIKEYEKLMEETSGEIPMSRKVSKVLYPDQKLEYEYDFGSTTELTVTTLAEYPCKADSKIVLLSRNEPLDIRCDACGKAPATEICTIHGWGEDSLFCPTCAKKHAKICNDFKDYASMPVVNSPRMGVCGYTGGGIDIERDGVYQVTSVKKQ